MQTDIFAQNIELNQPLREFIEEKVSDLEHLLGDAGPASARVEVGIPSQHHQSGPKFYAEINLNIAGQLLRAESSGYDLHAAIVDAKDELKTQIKKFKEKLTDRQRQPMPEE